MRAVRPGDRGPAVEDIQRRLLALGYDLGRTGVDGVYLGKTAEAVRVFQLSRSLSEDGVVGPATWAALVDATFRLGDRTLYLRLPYLHGADVALLQGALNALGFACGAVDGIFGAFTERGVREFQRNSGLPADGIVGSDTVAGLLNLRHVWDGKETLAHSAAQTAPARAAEVLATVAFGVAGDDPVASSVARRIVNLAHATTDAALAQFLGEGEPAPTSVDLVFRLTCHASASPGRRVVLAAPLETLSARLLAADPRSGSNGEILVDLADVPLADERDEQRSAIALLDALCAAFDPAQGA